MCNQCSNRPLSQEETIAVWLCVQDELLQDIVDLKTNSKGDHIEAAWDYSEKITTTLKYLITARDFSTDEKTDEVLSGLPTDHTVCEEFATSDLFDACNFGYLIRAFQACMVKRTMSVDGLFEELNYSVFNYFNCDNCGELSQQGLCSDWSGDTTFQESILADVSKWSLDLPEGGVVMDLIYALHVLVKVLKTVSARGITSRSPMDTFQNMLSIRSRMAEQEVQSNFQAPFTSWSEVPFPTQCGLHIS